MDNKNSTHEERCLIYWFNVCFWETATYPFPSLTVTHSSRFGQNVRFGEGKVGIFLETYIDPIYFHIPTTSEVDLKRFASTFFQEKRMVVPSALRVVRLKPGRKVDRQSCLL